MCKRTWSSSTSTMRLFIAPLAAVRACSTSAHSAPLSSAVSTAFTWPPMRRMRPRSFSFSCWVCMVVVLTGISSICYRVWIYTIPYWVYLNAPRPRDADSDDASTRSVVERSPGGRSRHDRDALHGVEATPQNVAGPSVDLKREIDRRQIVGARDRHLFAADFFRGRLGLKSRMMGDGESDRLIERQRSDRSLLGADGRCAQHEHGKGAHKDRPPTRAPDKLGGTEATAKRGTNPHAAASSWCVLLARTLHESCQTGGGRDASPPLCESA